MFCSNCGKEIPDNTNFCNYCGAPQNVGTTQNTGFTQNTGTAQNERCTQNTGVSQGMNMPPNQPKKPKKNWALRIIIPLFAAGAAFAIGYFATGAYKLKRPTPFETQDKFEFERIEGPSIKTDTEETLPDGYTSDAKVLDQKVYVVDNDAVKSKVFFNYDDDGVVVSVVGSLTYYDMSLGDIIDDLKNDAKYAKEFLTEIGAPPSSDVTLNETGSSVGVVFTFDLLKENSDMAELAAAFIGIKAENGKILIDSADAEMRGFGYALE